MERLNRNIKNIIDPPEKMLKMYESVMSFLQEEKDMGSLKVSEITARAGIGKGTAYEYFSSKEELITCAIMWGIAAKIGELEASVNNMEGFHEKIFCIFEWLEDCKEYAQIMIRIFKGNFGDSCCMEKEQVSESFGHSVQDHIFQKIDEMLEQGFSEGIFTMQNKEKRALVFFGAVLQYAFVIARPEKSMVLRMNQTELKEFVYESMVKALN